MSVTFLTNEDKAVIDKQLDDLSKGKMSSSGYAANKFLGTDEDGNVVEKDAPTSDDGGITVETDPTVPDWAKKSTKPTYTASEVGADPSGTASSVVGSHNSSASAHNDIRNLISGLTTRLNTLANSDDTTLDQLSEIVTYIKNNKSLIDSVTTGKVNVSDIVDNLTTNTTNKPLSAAQGVALKKLIDAIVVPTNVSQLTNDAGYLTEHQDISGLLPRTELNTAIDTALTEAKESGEFDGADGADGSSGVYIGSEEPTDESVNVWINPDSGVAIIPTIEHNTCSIFKKVVCVGDSFTSGHIHTGEDSVGTNEDYAWPSYMARLTGNEYINCGSSGATTITWLTHSRGLAKAQSTGVVQAYLVGLGLNDANNVGGITLGTAADIGTDAQTYYAGMSRIIRELNAISPKAKIFIQTMASNSSHTMACNVAIRDVVAAYADTYPVHLLDLEAYLPMYKTDLILGDKINGHYTAIGYQMFAENLRVIWSEYINNHIADFQDVYTLPYGTT